MKAIIPLELAGFEKLDFDLYNEKGEIVYKEGDLIAPSMLMKLNYIKIFKDEEIQKNFPLNPVNVAKVKKFKPIFSDNVKETLVKSAKNFIKKTYNGEPLRFEECVEVTECIVEKVYQKIKKISCIDQLRIYDEYTYSHNINVSAMCTALGITMKLDESEVRDLALGALLHDIGKMKVHKEILNKPDKLTRQEFEVMKTHTILGFKYIRENMEISLKISRIILDHHEKINGTGYPNGLKNSEINYFAQIVGIIDVYDALISDRVYKKAIFSQQALEILKSESGKSFNSQILNKFLCLAHSTSVADLF
jgi:putative nucleotidyltransferase with HDIG domain